MATFRYGYRRLARDDYDGTLNLSEILDGFGEWGAEGWELVCIKEDVAFFKKRTYSEEENALSNIDYDLERVLERLRSLESRETILIALLQDLVEKINPDSVALAALKLETAPEEAPVAPRAEAEEEETTAEATEGEAVKEDAPEEAVKEDAPEEEAPESRPTDYLIPGFADEHIELVMRGYEEEDKSLELFSRLVGYGGLLPTQSATGHYTHMLEALYRYYENDPNEKIAVCFKDALNRMALYLSSTGTLETLNKIAHASVTVAEGTDAFFYILSAELANERSGKSPFRVAEIKEFIEIFAGKIKEDPELYEDEALVDKLRAHIARVQQKFDIDCETV